ncbi:DUF6531 domain-containing protein, partial [Providencia manganoxydans]|uniref:DUF6531 domain-containing protein n=1 Tax=Providencia manganoxydans TaxID=2923283 RepID=UPI0034E47362
MQKMKVYACFSDSCAQSPINIISELANHEIASNEARERLGIYTQHLEYESNGKSEYLIFAKQDDGNIKVYNANDIDNKDNTKIITPEEYDAILDNIDSKLPRSKDVLYANTQANGNTVGTIIYTPLNDIATINNANNIVSSETDSETEIISTTPTKGTPYEQLSEANKLIYRAREEVMTTLNDIADDPSSGATGAAKQFYNDFVDTGELLAKGAMMSSALDSLKFSIFAKVSNLEWLSEYWAKKAKSDSQLANDIDANSLRAEFKNKSEEAGGKAFETASFFAAIPGAAKFLTKKLAKKAAQKEKIEPTLSSPETPPAGGTVKFETPPNKTPDTPPAKIKDESPDTKKTDKGENNPNSTKNTCGDPVDIVKGDLIQAWPVINIPGLLPIELTRTYYSTQSPRGIFGLKWADNWSMSLQIHDETIDFQDPEGSIYTFTASSDEVRSRNLRAPHYLLLGHKQSTLQIQDNRQQRIYHFELSPTSHRRLTKITNLQGVALRFHYNDEQQLDYLLRDDGFLIRLHYQHHQLTHIDYEHAQQSQRLVSCQYDHHGYLSECDAFQQNHLWHTYTAQGWMTSWRDTDQTALSIDYDNQGRVIQTHSDSGYWCDRFFYDDTLLINTYVDGEGGHFRYYYNEDQLIVRTLDPLGRETRTQWRDFQKISETNDMGETTHYTYHPDGLIAQIYLPDNRKVGYEYNENGQLTRYIAPTGDVWQLDYDVRGNLATVTTPQGLVQTYEYSQHGELLKSIAPNGAQWQYQYNATHQLIKSTNPYQQSTEYQFDELGRLQAYTDALKHTTQYRYDPNHAGVNGSVSNILLPDGVQQQIEYDSERRVVAVTDGEARTTRYRYGPFDLLTSMIRPDGTAIHFEYDALTRLKKVINALGETYTYERDAAGQIIRETDFAGRVLEYRYDRLGRRIATRYPDKHELRWRYAPSGVVIEQSEWLDDGLNHQCLSTTTYEYDTHLRLIKATNPDSVVEFEYEYDAHGQLTCERINGREVHHQWDEATLALTQTRFGERELHYAFGQLGELTQLQVNQHRPLEFSYNAVGQEYLRRSDVGFVNSSHYNAAGLLAHQRAGRGSDNFLWSLYDNPHQPPMCTDVHRDFHYNRAHNVVAIEDARWQRTQYHYNANDQITETQYSSERRSQYERFQYDANLNLTEHTTLPEDAHTAIIQLAQEQQAGRVIRRNFPKGHKNYFYDANGRLERKMVYQHGYRPQEWRYQWNTQNQLIRCFTPSGDVWRYTYDAFGRRLSKTKVVDILKINESPAFPLSKQRITAWHYLW